MSKKTVNSDITTSSFIKVTVVEHILNEVNEKKLDAFVSVEDSEKDQYGHTRDSYETMGIPIPKDSNFFKKKKQLDLFENEDLDLTYRTCYFNKSDFLMVLESLDFGSTITLRTGEIMDVLESPKKIIKKLSK